MTLFGPLCLKNSSNNLSSGFMPLNVPVYSFVMPSSMQYVTYFTHKTTLWWVATEPNSLQIFGLQEMYTQNNFVLEPQRATVVSE